MAKYTVPTKLSIERASKPSAQRHELQEVARRTIGVRGAARIADFYWLDRPARRRITRDAFKWFREQHPEYRNVQSCNHSVFGWCVRYRHNNETHHERVPDVIRSYGDAGTPF